MYHGSVAKETRLKYETRYMLSHCELSRGECRKIA